HVQAGTSFWQLAYVAHPDATNPTQPGFTVPAIRTGDKELGPLFGFTGGAGARIALGEQKTYAISVVGNRHYTRLLDPTFLPAPPRPPRLPRGRHAGGSHPVNPRCPFLVLFLALVAPAGCGNPAVDPKIAALGPEANGVPQGEFHRSGQPCLLCHGPYGGASP